MKKIFLYLLLMTQSLLSIAQVCKVELAVAGHLDKAVKVDDITQSPLVHLHSVNCKEEIETSYISFELYAHHNGAYVTVLPNAYIFDKNEVRYDTVIFQDPETFEYFQEVTILDVNDIEVNTSNTSMKLTANQLKFIENLKSGDKLIFRNIKARMGPTSPMRHIDDKVYIIE